MNQECLSVDYSTDANNRFEYYYPGYFPPPTIQPIQQQSSWIEVDKKIRKRKLGFYSGMFIGMVIIISFEALIIYLLFIKIHN